jgi:hypothetical protein
MAESSRHTQTEGFHVGCDRIDFYYLGIRHKLNQDELEG